MGYDEGGQLTEKVRRKPYSVVLFDEIEKANEDVFNILLQIMDDGRLTDSQGRRVDFRNTIVVMTSNVGARCITEGRRSLGFGGESGERSHEEIRALITADLKRTFRPEFLNRIDETIVFHQLSREHIRAVAGLMLDTVRQRLSTLGLGLTVTDAALDTLCDKGFDAAYGARPLRRCIQSRVEDAVAELMLSGGLTAGGTAHVDAENGEIKVTKE